MTGTELILPNGDVLPIVDRRAARVLEVRDPKAATIPTRFVSPTLPQVEEWDAEQAWRLGVIANVIAYRCVQIRANAGAAIPLVAGRKMGDPKTINDNAPIAKLLGPPPGGPAPRLSARKLLRWTLAQEIVTGRRAWEIETHDGTKDGRPVAFWPLAAAKLRAHPSKRGSQWFRLFEYGPHHEPIRLPPELVFYGWDPSGNDFRQAESALQAARFDLTLVNLCDRYGIGFLRNNAVPAAIVTTTEFPSEAARRKFLAAWRAEFGGPDNAGRVALNEVSADGAGPVADSIDVKQLGLSAKDSRLIETRKDAMAEIAIALGVPWSKLDASGRTFDNAEVEDRSFYEETVLPDLVDLQDDINMQLAPRLGDEVVWFDLRGVRALQRKITPITQTVGAPALLFAQIMTINEARADYGLEPVDGGDRVLTAEEINALRGTADEGGADAVRTMLRAITTGALPPASEASQEAGGDDDGQSAPPSEPPARRERRIADPELVEQRRARIWRAADAVVTALEQRWQRSIRRLFARQLDASLARLTGKRGRQMLTRAADEPAPDIDPGVIFDQAFWLAATAELADDLYDEVVVAGLNRLTVSYDVSFDVTARWVREFIEARAQQLAGQVTQTTYDAIRTELVAGVADGESIDDLAKRIRKVFAHADQTRAVTIARTEVISAYNGAAVLGASQMPGDVIAAQEWIATRDSRTRKAHGAVDGEVVRIGEQFSLGLAYPGDPSGPASQTVNCRCTVAFLTPEEYAELEDRGRLTVETRTALAMLRLVTADTDLLAWRRALEEVAA